MADQIYQSLTPNGNDNEVTLLQKINALLAGQAGGIPIQGGGASMWSFGASDGSAPGNGAFSVNSANPNSFTQIQINDVALDGTSGFSNGIGSSLNGNGLIFLVSPKGDFILFNYFGFIANGATMCAQSNGSVQSSKASLTTWPSGNYQFFFCQKIVPLSTMLGFSGITPIANGNHTVGANTITTSSGIITAIT